MWSVLHQPSIRPRTAAKILPFGHPAAGPVRSGKRISRFPRRASAVLCTGRSGCEGTYSASRLEIEYAIPTSADLRLLPIMISCRVCWRLLRWHIHRTRRFRNLSTRKVSQDCLTSLNRKSAQRIPSWPGAHAPERAETFAHHLSFSFFSCDEAADHTSKLRRLANYSADYCG